MPDNHNPASVLDTSRYQSSFEAIALAGCSKAESMGAIDAASEGRLDDAAELLRSADSYLGQAHETQRGLAEDEALGRPVDVNIMLVHAQDHLAMAQTARDTAGAIVTLYGKLEELRAGTAA